MHMQNSSLTVTYVENLLLEEKRKPPTCLVRTQEITSFNGRSASKTP
jgi:hypothetical protein